MTVELNFGNVLALGSAFVLALWALVKVISRQQESALEQRFKSLNESIQGVSDNVGEERKSTQRLERELMQLRAELPRDYVRRDDYIRALGTIEAKIDNMALRVERAVSLQPSQQVFRGNP